MRDGIGWQADRQLRVILSLPKGTAACEECNCYAYT
jgi:hypothetical protein